MKKNLMFLIPIAFMCMLFTISTITASDMPENIVMESKVHPKHSKPLVSFTHKKHSADYGIACTDCHHDYKDKKNVWKEGDAVLKCEECHSEAKKPTGVEMTKEEEMKKYHYTAIHANCKGCHAALKKEGKDTGPTTCTKCHVK